MNNFLYINGLYKNIPEPYYAIPIQSFFFLFNLITDNFSIQSISFNNFNFFSVLLAKNLQRKDEQVIIFFYLDVFNNISDLFNNI